MSDYLVRQALRSDIPAILELCIALWTEHSRLDSTFAVTPLAPSIHGTWLKRNLNRSDCRILVATAGEQVIGSAAANIGEAQLFWPPRYGYIRDLYVTPAKRRSGIGSALVANLLTWLGTRDVRRVELMALAANADASGFWGAMGFEAKFLVFHKRT